MSRIFCQNVLSVFTVFGIYLRLEYWHAMLFIFIVQLSDLFWILHSQKIQGALKKFCNSTIKKNGNVTNCTLFLNIVTTDFNAFATLLCQTANSIPPATP